MVCGNNPLYDLYLKILGIELENIPRFRDVYVIVGTDPEIVIYTRTGGGNRSEYEDQNESLANHPGYLRDEDDSFDNTFAHFHYSVPERFKTRVSQLQVILGKYDKFKTPREKFEKALNAVSAKTPPDQVNQEAPSEHDTATIEKLIDSLIVDLE